MTARFNHKASDRSRLKEAKGTILTLEDRVRAIEEREREREVQDKLTLEWETCDRLAQGFNDFIKNAIMNPEVKEDEDGEVEDLSGAKIIWGDTNRYRYLPLLFTQWWLYWNTTSPELYPLPAAFDTLSESDINDFLSRRDLGDEISGAAALLWDSSLKPAIDLMLTLYHKRPQARNRLQHPTPSAAFAHTYFRSMASYDDLSEKQKRVAQATIDSGRRRGGSLLFTPP